MIQKILLSVCMMFALSSQAQTDYAYIQCRTFTESGEKTWIDSRTVDNGLGDIERKVDIGITPNKQDLVQFNEYDTFRRPVKSWLPVVSSDGISATLTSLKSYSQTSLYQDSEPYSTISYQNSPISLSKTTMKAGSVWHSQGVGQTEKETRLHGYIFQLGNFQGSNDFTCQSVRDYNGIIKTDEEGNTITEGYDASGKIKLVSMQNDGDRRLITYYVYDRYERLRYVIPPKISATFDSDGLAQCFTIVDSSSLMKQYGYIYKYDGRNNLIYKKLPGCEPVYYIYDKANRLILTQDGNNRKSGKWLFTIPDKYGRSAISGFCTASYDYTSDPLYNVVVAADLSSSTNTYTIQGITIGDIETYQENYYDDYSFIQTSGLSNLAFSQISGMGVPYSNSKGRKTCCKIAMLSNNGITGYRYNAVYYDYLGRIVQTRTTNNLGGLDVVSSKYDFVGNVLSSYHQHTATNKSSQTELLTYIYDHAGRLLTTTHKLNSNNAVVLASNSYDELGRLVSVKRNNSAALTTANTYDINSELTRTKTSDLFDENIYYNESNNGNTPLYNGAISSVQWTIGGITQNYNYYYNKISNLIQADYTNTSNKSANYNTSYTYDEMGNILTMKRNGLQDGGTYGLVDNLTYQYNGNQIISISDKVTDPTYKDAFNFFDYVSLSTEYQYDANGNMVTDLNKNISSITYNALNLPTYVTASSWCDIYTYDASGEKIKVYYGHNGGAPITLDYCGNMIYENGVLKQILVAGGYITLNGTTPTYHFYVTDHLGNNRLVADQNGTVEQCNNYYPFGGIMGNSTNQSEQRYKYNGKELERMHGENLYDYGARFYDAAMCRFTTIDPHAESYYNISPYVYCMNDPVNKFDPDGRKVVLDKNASSMFVADYNKTISTLMRNGCGEVWKKLNESSEVYTITENNSYSNYFDPSNKTISWNSRMGLLTTSGNFISPATRLNHELDHALQYDTNIETYNRDVKTSVGGEDETYTVEEKRVVEGTESRTAIRLGEIEEGTLTRLDHSGSPFPTNSPISNEELNKNKIIITPSNK